MITKEIDSLVLVCYKKHKLLEVNKKYNADMRSCLFDNGKRYYFYTVYFNDGRCSEFNVKGKQGLYGKEEYLIPLAEWRNKQIETILKDD